MKPRERLLAAINHEETDRVPVHPRFNDMTLLREFGGLNRQQLPGYDPERGQRMEIKEWRMKVYEWMGVDDLIIGIGPDALPRKATSWKPFETRRRIIESYPDYDIGLTEYVTPAGTLRETRRLGHFDADKTEEHMITYENLEENMDKLRYIYSVDHDKRTFEGAKRIKEWLGDKGITEGSAGGADASMSYKDMFKLMHLKPKLYEEYEKMAHESSMFALRVLLEKAEPDLVGGGGGFQLQQMREELYNRWVDPYVKERNRLILKYGAYPLWHQDGPGVKYLEKIRDSGVKVLECMDMPPLGDIYMAEAKKRIGDDVCFLGNVDLMTIFQGTPKEVEALTKYVVEEGAPGGGLIASTGDSPPLGTPLINMQTLVKTAKKYGRYPIRRK